MKGIFKLPARRPGRRKNKRFASILIGQYRADPVLWRKITNRRSLFGAGSVRRSGTFAEYDVSPHVHLYSLRTLLNCRRIVDAALRSYGNRQFYRILAAKTFRNTERIGKHPAKLRYRGYLLRTLLMSATSSIPKDVYSHFHVTLPADTFHEFQKNI
jgi:hypothetical protein